LFKRSGLFMMPAKVKNRLESHVASPFSCLA
jgi:hypothetical protein